MPHTGEMLVVVMTKLKGSSLVEFLTKTLECKQKTLAIYTGLNESTICSHLESNLDEISKTKAGRRLFGLFVCVDALSKKGITAEVIKESLNEYVYPDIDENMDSVISALHQDKYSPSVLKNIAQLGYAKFQEKLVQRAAINEQIYQAFSSANKTANAI